MITKSNFGGAQRYVFDLAIGARDAGYEACVALGGDGILAEKLRNAGIRTVAIGALGRDINPMLDLAALRELVNLFKNEAPDVVHLNSSKVGVLGSLAAWWTCVPKVLFTSHGWAFNDPRLSFFVRALAYPLHIATIFLCDAVIAVSQKTRAQIAWFPFTKRKIVVIRNGVETTGILERESACKEICTHIKTDAHDSFLIGALSELHPVKGLSYLIGAIKTVRVKHKDVVLVVFGEGGQREQLQKQIEDSNLEGAVILAGFHTNAPMLLRGFDLFVLPSLSEALGYAALEAGLAELPVVATAVGGTPEVIENNTTGTLVPPKNSAALAQAINTYYEDPGLRKAHAYALHKKVSEKFTLKEMLRNTLALY